MTKTINRLDVAEVRDPERTSADGKNMCLLTEVTALKSICVYYIQILWVSVRIVLRMEYIMSRIERIPHVGSSELSL